MEMKTVAMAAVLAVAGGSAAFGWTHRSAFAAASTKETTTTLPHATASVRAEGRVVTYPGGEVTVGTDVAGTLKTLRVVENQVVKKGELIAEIRADEEQAALVESRARVNADQVDIAYFTHEKERTARLYGEKVVPDGEMDKSTHALESAKAESVVAQATAAHLAATLAKRRILSPIDGTVVTRVADPGETVEAGASLVTIADLAHLRIEAEVDELDATHAFVGASVRVTAEGIPGVVWRGHIEEVPHAVAPRRLKPEDPAKPSDTHVVLAKVALDEPTPLLLGQRVEVAIDAP